MTKLAQAQASLSQAEIELATARSDDQAVKAMNLITLLARRIRHMQAA